MISKLWTLYLRINYCAQRISPSFFVPRSIINTIMGEISFITSGIVMGVMALMGLRDPLIAAVILFSYVMLLWHLFSKKVANTVYRRLDELEEYYLSINNIRRAVWFVITISMVGGSVFFMYYFAVVIIKMGNS